jgi:hypothetical protein
MVRPSSAPVVEDQLIGELAVLQIPRLVPVSMVVASAMSFFVLKLLAFHPRKA